MNAPTSNRTRRSRLLSRRCLASGCIALTALLVLTPKVGSAFGEETAFDPRILLAGGANGAAFPSATTVWTGELAQRTSAPTKTKVSSVRADDSALLKAPFAYWSGKEALKPLTSADISGLRRFLGLGGILVVDDAGGGAAAGTLGAFGKSARTEIGRVLPDALPIALPAEHVLYRSFYQLKLQDGKEVPLPAVDAIAKNGQLQVLFLKQPFGENLVGRAADPQGGLFSPMSGMSSGGDARERTIRFAVNIAMYALCSDYKDDQVHATFIMRRRSRMADPVLKP
jgi:Domain of unknown function (DUF4159)